MTEDLEALDTCGLILAVSSALFCAWCAAVGLVDIFKGMR